MQDQNAGAEVKTKDRPKRFIRHAHLVEDGLTMEWKQTLRMIEEEQFPPGFLVSSRIRVWDVEEVERWVAARKKLDTKADVGFRRTPRRKAAPADAS